ncbi:hypothetical protein BD289DRAFT_198531 [Coniella lustricola]|uniref:Uncharacterized protein n=1 Tax=Coniella lustricola TaxID=2025994 RepID=A0A2T3ACN7_9PEZI|nr:hypothetical protein BD289DRAFT_198531 [Coniella lustricola]
MGGALLCVFFLSFSAVKLFDEHEEAIQNDTEQNLPSRVEEKETEQPSSQDILEVRPISVGLSVLMALCMASITKQLARVLCMVTESLALACREYIRSERQRHEAGLQDLSRGGGVVVVAYVVRHQAAESCGQCP